MKTQTLKTEIVNLNEIQTTCQPLNAAECDEVLRFTTANQGQEKALSLQYVEYGECGYERKSDWMRLINKIDRYDTTPIKRMITGDKKSLDWGDFIIHREDITYSEDGFLIEFKNPVKVLIEEIGEKALLIEVRKLRGEITWEWSYRRSGHEELENYAGVLEIFIYDVEIVE